MTVNVGSTDRVVRIILGVVFLVLAFVLSDALRWVFGVLGLVMFATAAINFCPIWAVLGINTLGKSNPRH